MDVEAALIVACPAADPVVGDQRSRLDRAAQVGVLDRLPFSQVVNHVELWSGPALATAPAGSWQRLRDYSLCDPS